MAISIVPSLRAKELAESLPADKLPEIVAMLLFKLEEQDKAIGSMVRAIREANLTIETLSDKVEELSRELESVDDEYDIRTF